jgi:TFIIF-interacting CTD phosphatase-like protein
MSTRTADRKLLLLDLDETLVHARETPLEREEDFRVGEYFVYRRPHVDAFIAGVLASFDVAVWTSSGERYAAQVIERIFPAGALKFVWSSNRCTMTRDWTTGGFTNKKDLAKLKRRGYSLESIIAVDDTPAKYSRSYGNLVTVKEFVGDTADDELPLLLRYLETLVTIANVRILEKRRWREKAKKLESNET